MRASGRFTESGARWLAAQQDLPLDVLAERPMDRVALATYDNDGDIVLVATSDTRRVGVRRWKAPGRRHAR